MFRTRLIRPLSSVVSGWCNTHSTVQGTPVNISRQSRSTTSGPRGPSSAWGAEVDGRDPSAAVGHECADVRVPQEEKRESRFEAG